MPTESRDACRSPGRGRCPRAVLAHCWTGSPASGWYPAIAGRLRGLGLEVTAPALPDTDDPDPDAWVSALDAAIGSTDDVMLIGHSLGALALLRWLIASRRPVAAVALVAPPIGPGAHAVVDRFMVGEDKLQPALAAVGRSLIVVSDSDPYLLPSPFAVADAFVRVGAKRLLVPGGGHFSPASGRIDLPELGPFLTGFAARHRDRAPGRATRQFGSRRQQE